MLAARRPIYTWRRLAPSETHRRLGDEALRPIVGIFVGGKAVMELHGEWGFWQQSVAAEQDN